MTVTASTIAEERKRTPPRDAGATHEFRIDNTDHIIDVNRGNIPYEYDQVNLVCPSYSPSTPEEEAEKYIIYNVSKEEYDTCRITNPNPRIIAVSTSSREDLHRRIGGRCKTSNMRIVFKVCCKPGEEDGNQVQIKRPSSKEEASLATSAKNGTSSESSASRGPSETFSSSDLGSNNVDRVKGGDQQQQQTQVEQGQEHRHQHRHEDNKTHLADELARSPTLSETSQRWGPPRVLTTRRPGQKHFDNDDAGGGGGGVDNGRSPVSGSNDDNAPVDFFAPSATTETTSKNKNFGYPIFSVKATNKKNDVKYDRTGNEIVKEELQSRGIRQEWSLATQLAMSLLICLILPRLVFR
ncbi:unnamed protein product [Notodromas monacha]|uniref:Ephrin RBD domain-containing protein n=1 Tax=Notodromas monacha TaxID=399045 RepID=A0A7R9GKH8_9CRUS|nr:unnamed protein product [Notodromas monacha]CAG0923923.1 unnamed protein product [Notodromas monacha]